MYERSSVHTDQKGLTRLTGLIQLGGGILNGLILLRFVLKLMAISSEHPIAGSVYLVTSPFLWLFRGLMQIPPKNVEYSSLVAILVYTMAAWILVQLVWILSARRK